MRVKQLDPRQIKFLELYLDPKSETYANAYKSAVKAGFSDKYADSITIKNLKWLEENVGDIQLVQKALKNLKELLDEKKDKRIKADITKFVLERLNKKKFSPKTEVEHSGSIEEIQKVDDKQKELISNFNLWVKKQIKK